MKNEIDKIIEDLKNHPLLEGYHIDKTNASEFYRFVTEHKNCQVCQGLQQCKNTSKGYQPCLKETPYPHIVYKACRYFHDFSKQDNVLHLYVAGNADANLNNFDLINEDRKKMFAYASQFVTEYKRGEFMKGMYLAGSFGSGKTYFLSALANELASRNIKSIIAFFPDLSRTLKSAINSNELEHRISLLKNVDVLMLDDFGGEMASTWLRDEIVAPIFQHRLQENLPIFISSNLKWKELQAHLSATKDGIDDMKASRIIERIKAMMVYVELNQRYQKES